MRQFLATTSLITMITLSVSTHAKDKTHPTPKRKNPCHTLTSCADHVSHLLGHKYLYAEKLKGEVNFSKNLKLTKDNINEYFSEALHLNGYTRVKIKDGVYRILKARDIRYSPVSIIEVKDYNTSSIPSLSDYFLVSLKLKHPDYPSEITRSLRPFMSRYGRIITAEHTGSIIIQDTGRNLKRIIGIIKNLDIPISDEHRERLEKIIKRRHESKMSQKCSSSNPG